MSSKSSFAKHARLLSVAALAAAALACGAERGQAQNYNTSFYNYDYLNTTGATATSLELAFSGNVTADLTTFYDQFPSPTGPVIQGSIPYSSPALSVSASYNPATNTTTLVYAGTGAAAPAQYAHVGYGLTGYSGTSVYATSPPITTAYWDNSGGTLGVTAPSITPTITGAGSLLNLSGSQVSYVILFADATTSGSGSVAGEWSEIPVPTSSMGTPAFANDSTVPLTLSNVGFQLSPTLIPLDNLNFNSEPPSGMTPFSGIPNGTTVAPGQDVAAPLPEPSALALLAAGAALLIGCRRPQRMLSVVWKLAGKRGRPRA